MFGVLSKGKPAVTGVCKRKRGYRFLFLFFYFLFLFLSFFKTETDFAKESAMQK